MDITYYPIEKGKELTWFNDDDVSHRMIINVTTEESNSTELVADSGIIKPEDSYAHTFEDEGTYHFSSPTHPWIKGIVFVNDDISTATQTDSVNNIDVQLSLTPLSPKIGQQTHFKIIFIKQG